MVARSFIRQWQWHHSSAKLLSWCVVYLDCSVPLPWCTKVGTGLGCGKRTRHKQRHQTASGFWTHQCHPTSHQLCEAICLQQRKAFWRLDNLIKVPPADLHHKVPLQYFMIFSWSKSVWKTVCAIQEPFSSSKMFPCDVNVVQVSWRNTTLPHVSGVQYNCPR